MKIDHESSLGNHGRILSEPLTPRSIVRPPTRELAIPVRVAECGHRQALSLYVASPSWHPREWGTSDVPLCVCDAVLMVLVLQGSSVQTSGPRPAWEGKVILHGIISM